LRNVQAAEIVRAILDQMAMPEPERVRV
jgi:hypothetical protein